jgi:tryptophan synthase beta chain
LEGKQHKAVLAEVVPDMTRQILYNITTEEIPKKWYNILPDLPTPFPMHKDPDEGPSRLERLPKLLIGECLKQELSDEAWIDIPEGVRELFRQAGRPRPLFRAVRLEEKLGTPARMYYKSEFYSPTGSHKVNTALAQAYYAKEQGYERLTTETGAGQWGTALSYACAVVGLKLTVYWVRAVYKWKLDRLNFMRLYGADVHASPSPMTESGKKLYDQDPDDPGSLAIAISEGLEDAYNHDDSIYSLGSVLNHVLTQQTVIGLETLEQFKLADDYPDMMFSCLGGGSNFGGFVIPFVGERLKRNLDTKFVAAQSEVAPNLQGEYTWDFGDHAEMTPLIKVCTLGHKKRMDPIFADGLRYHAAAPIISSLRNDGLIDTVAYPKDEKYVFDRAKLFMTTEGFLPAPESSYGVCAMIDEALRCKETGEEKVLAANISGHGFMDMYGFSEVLGLS